MQFTFAFDWVFILRSCLGFNALSASNSTDIMRPSTHKRFQETGVRVKSGGGNKIVR